MSKNLKIHLKVDADTGKLTQVSDGFVKFDKRVKQSYSAVDNFNAKIMNIAKGVAGIYLVNKAFDLAVSSAQSFVNTASQFEEYGNRMTAFTQSQAEANSEMARGTAFAQKFNISIADTMDTMLTLKNYGIDDTNESLKIFTNTAIGSGKSLSQYAEAVADALTGENERLKEFGVKASKIGEEIGYVWTDSAGKTRNIIIENNKDTINSTLNAIMNEKYVGQIEKRAASWKGLMQNMDNNWTIFQKNVGDEGLFDYFRLLGESITKSLKSGFENGSMSAKQFADDTISFIQTILKGVGYLAKALSGIANLARVIYAGFLKLDGALGQAMNTSSEEGTKKIVELQARLDAMKDTDRRGNSTSAQKNAIQQNIDGIKAEMKAYDEYTARRTAGGNLVESAAKSQENINNIIDGITQISTKNATVLKTTTSDITAQKDAAVAALNGINAGYGNLSATSTKVSKATGKAAKDIKKSFDKIKPFDPSITLDDLDKGLEDSAKRFTDNIRSGFDALFSGDLKGMVNSIFGDAMTGITDKVSTSVGGTAGGILGGLTGGLMGLGISAISELLTTTVTQAEIDASIGRVEFDDDSLKNLEGVFADAQYPMLEVTNKMYGHLRNMDANFYSIARAFSAQASSGGVDLTGSNFVDTQSSTFLGFSSKSVSLIGTGLNFALSELGDMMDASALDVNAYTTSLKTKTSLFGIVSKQKIQEVATNLPYEVVSDMADAFANGYEAIMTAGVSLGLNEATLSKQLLAAKVAIGKIDFTGLSDDEVANRLSQAYSTYFSGVIKGVDDFSVLISRYGQNTEEALATLGRMAVEYDQGSHVFGLIGKTFTDGTADILKESTSTILTLVTAENMRMLTASNRVVQGGKSYISSIVNVSEMVASTYTEQMQILDIIESTGGLTNFQDAMGAFMSGFYTEAEQLDFLTKSMAQSFSTLGITMPKTDAEFRTLLETMDTSTESGAYAYGQVLLLADGFNQMTDATDKAAEGIEDLTISIEDMIKNVSDAWLGNLSYLTLQQKTAYASGYLTIASSSNGTIDTVEAARLAAETALKTTATKEEYIPIFERYISELEKQAPESTLDDVVGELKALKLEVVALKSATIDAAKYA